MTEPLMIGEFARRCRLPVSTLRYYDKIGLLVPAVVDAVSGYRRYTAEQLSDALLIARLRSIGMAPRDIAAVLAGGASAVAALVAERGRVAGQVIDAQRALVEINELLTYHHARTHPVQVVDMAHQRIAAAPFLTPHTELASAVLRGIARLRSALRRAGCHRRGPWGAALPLQITSEVRGFVFAHTTEPVDQHARLAAACLPAARAAQSVHTGDPATLAWTYHTVLDALPALLLLYRVIWCLMINNLMGARPCKWEVALRADSGGSGAHLRDRLLGAQAS